MASVDFKVKYEEELKARKRAELERDTLAKQLGKKSSGITVDEIQEEQAQLVLNNSALSLNGVQLDQLKTHSQIGVLAEVNSRDVPVFVELHGEKDLSKVTRVRIIVEAEDEPVAVANDADLDAVVSHANEGKLDVATVKKAHKKPSLRLPLFRFLFDHRRKANDKESKQKANAAVLAVVPNKKLFKEVMDAEEDEDPETREHASKLLKDLEDDLAKGKKKDSWKFSLALHLRRFKLDNARGKKIKSSLKDASEKDDDDDEDRDFEVKSHLEKPHTEKHEKSPKPEKQPKVKKVKSSGGGSSSSSSSESDSEKDKDSNDKDKEGKKKGGFGGKLPGLKLSIGGKDKAKEPKADKEKEKKEKEEKAKKEKEDKEKAKKEQEEKKKADKEKERLEKEKAKADKTKKPMDLPEEPEVMKTKSAEHTSTAPTVVEPQHEEEEKNCHLCHSENAKFSCKNCGHKVCANDSTTKFTSFLLGWKHHKRVCDSCLEKIKVEISKKSQEDPSIKEQADKEIQGIDDAKVKISKKKNQTEGKKDYSSSSSSSSSSADENGNKEKEKRKRGLSIGMPSFGFGGKGENKEKSEKEKLKAEKEKADKEKAEKEKAEKEKLKAEKEKADKEKAEKEKAEKEKLKAEKEKADKEKAEKEKAEKEKLKAEKDKAGKKPSGGKVEVTAEEPETMGKAKRVEATQDVAHSNCHVCHDDFSKKRQYSCRNCGEKVCHECSTTRFSSFLLSWKQNHRVCENCLEHMKAEITKKSTEDPSVKDQADAELRSANDLKVRISKKKSKAEVSGSSSSSSDTDSHSDNDYTQITSAHSSHALDIKENSTEPGSHVIVWEKHGNNNQKWRVTKKGYIESKAKKGLVLDYVEDNGKKILCVNNKKKTDSQKWKVEGNGIIVNKQTGTAIDIEGASKEKGATVLLWDKHGNSNQLWNVELPKKKVKAIKLPGIGLPKGHSDKEKTEKSDKEKTEKPEKVKAEKPEKAPKAEKAPKEKKVKKEKKDKKKGEDSSSSSSSSSSEDEKDKEKVSGSIGKKKGFGLNLKLGKSDKDKSDKDKQKAEKAAHDKLKKEEKEKEKLEKEKQKKEEKEKQDKEKADKEKQKKEEKEKADKEKADKEKADKEKADKDKKKVAPLVALDVKKKVKSGSDSDSSDSDSDDDYHEVTSNLNGLVLEGDLNHPVTTNSKNGNNSQKWRLNKNSQLENANGHVLDFKEENGVKKLVVSEKDQNSETQKFQLEGPIIINKSTGLAVDIKEAKKEPGADVILWEKHGNTHQQWKWDFSLKMPKIKLNKKEKKPKSAHEHEHGPCPFCRREYQILNPEVDEEMQKLNSGEISKEEMLRKKLEMIGKAEKLLAEMKAKYEQELQDLKK